MTLYMLAYAHHRPSYLAQVLALLAQTHLCNPLRLRCLVPPKATHLFSEQRVVCVCVCVCVCACIPAVHARAHTHTHTHLHSHSMRAVLRFLLCSSLLGCVQLVPSALTLLVCLANLRCATSCAYAKAVEQRTCARVRLRDCVRACTRAGGRWHARVRARHLLGVGVPEALAVGLLFACHAYIVTRADARRVGGGFRGSGPPPCAAA